MRIAQTGMHCLFLKLTTYNFRLTVPGSVSSLSNYKVALISCALQVEITKKEQP